MNIVIKDEKISDFRDLVNSNSNFVYKKYSDNNGKNHWNLICSCMDWISVSISFLQNPCFRIDCTATPGIHKSSDATLCRGKEMFF